MRSPRLRSGTTKCVSSAATLSSPTRTSGIVKRPSCAVVCVTGADRDMWYVRLIIVATMNRMGGVRDKNLWDLFGETLVTKKQQIKSTSTALDLARTNVQAHEKHLKDLKVHAPSLPPSQPALTSSL